MKIPQFELIFVAVLAGCGIRSVVAGRLVVAPHDDLSIESTRRLDVCAAFVGQSLTNVFGQCGCEENGLTLTLDCSACETCALGACGEGQFAGDYRFADADEFGVRIVGDFEESFTFTSGTAGTGVIRSSYNTVDNTCDVRVGNDICQSCDLRNCTDGELDERILADCTNVAGGQVFDFCQETVTVENRDTLFLFFDTEFRNNMTQCAPTSGSLQQAHWSAWVASTVAFWALIAAFSDRA